MKPSLLFAILMDGPGRIPPRKPTMTLPTATVGEISLAVGFKGYYKHMDIISNNVIRLIEDINPKAPNS